MVEIINVTITRNPLAYAVRTGGQQMSLIKNLLRRSRFFKALTCGLAGAPTSPGRVLVSETAHGRRLLYTADTVTEAEWIQQALHDAGFSLEHIPSTMAGVFGIAGNSSIYVLPEEYEEAQEFLSVYLDPPAGTEIDEPFPS